MAEESRRRLGRGLAALLGDAAADVATVERPRGPRKAPIEFLRPNPRNPRLSFREEDLAELTASIRQKGVIQPIVVRALAGVADAYEIIAGERRWRAAQMAGLSDVPVVIHEADDKEALELAIIENVQRADLNAIEEAKGYERLGEEFGYSHGEIAKIIGKSRPHIANTIRLLNLPEEAKKLVAEGAISAGHARALLAVADPAAVARRIVEKGMTVRDVERLAQDEIKNIRPAKRSGRSAKDADTRAIEKTLSDALGMRVELRPDGEKGELRIRYGSLEQLESICRLLGG
ncbi:ParB/RepB/Spo0J family partition protein [Methylocystis sp. B8]|uniref:ParB/RepB/Spo0J family partition protein n=1 Tax=Methylocystis sp. B8 TaxID=544938 RepID=UPI0010FDE3BB|nr:ParB/RepB/Spo0J family partition protein [Methylocystis sp. B8]TLG76853.1 ParB/RepB/Spo0J family partition protein [Methylocystis sp. B8]